MAALDPNLSLLNGPSPSATPVSDPNLAVLNSAPPASADPNLTALNSSPAPPPLSEDDFQTKLKTRWGSMLTGQSMAAPADITEMQASGKFTPEQIQRVQTETALRQADIEQQAKTGGHPWLLHPLASAGEAVSAIPGAVWNMVKDLPQLARLAPTPENLANAPENLQSALQGGYDAGAGLAKLGAGLVTGPVSAAASAWSPPLTPAQQEQAYQQRKLDYLNAQTPQPSAIQTAESAYTGIPAAALPAPDPALANAVSTAATLPLYGAAAKLTEGIIPKALEAVGLTKAAPTLSKLVTPAAPGAANAGKIAAAAEEAIAGNPTTPSLASRAANGVLDAAGRAISGIGSTASAIAAKVNGIPGLGTDTGKFVVAATLGPYARYAMGAVKALEAAGPKVSDLGDLMSRVASASPTDPFGRFMAVATQPDAAPWMRKFVQNPALQLALKAGNLGAETAKGFAKGAAVGGAMSAISGQTPEEAGQNAAGMGVFGAAHGALGAREAGMLDANIGAVSKFVTDSLAAGTSPETLKLVPLSDVMQAALMKNALPDQAVRFATPLDAGSPFGPNGAAINQAGYYDSANKTLWIDPTKRAPGSTLLHESYHPIFDNLGQQPEIKASIDYALKNSGSSLDEFKQQYAAKVYPNDPQAAASYIQSQDAANPNWAYSEMLSESAAHNLDGADLLPAMEGQQVQQTASQAALAGVSGWLSDMGVDLQKHQSTGTIFPNFTKSFNDPGLRKLTYNLLKAQRDTLSKPSVENPGVPLKPQDIGTPKAPLYTGPNGEQFNAYGRMIPGATGPQFKAWPASEIKRRGLAEKAALRKYFPEAGKLLTTMPAGLEADPNITPWTKASLRAQFDAIQSKDKLSLWYHRLNSENSATSDKSRGADIARNQGNVQVSYQSGQPLGVKRTAKDNIISQFHSEEAENQKLAAWAQRTGPLSLDLWNGDIGKAKADIQTYLENHATGQPGDANGIGAAKRDVINALLAGGNKEFEAKNPLRAQIRKADRQGIIRDLRADRMESPAAEPTQRPPAQWESLKHNLSPAATDLRPAIKQEDGTIIPGKAGQIHTDIIRDAMMNGILADGERGFVDGKGNFLNREDAAKSIGTIGPLHSQDLAKLQTGQPQFSPSDDPNAIKAAAVRDRKTGKIFPGNSHIGARNKSPKAGEDLEDGFVTNSGKFLGRDEALARAVAMKQYKPTDEDSNFVTKKLYGLTSERFNKQNPNAAVAGHYAQPIAGPKPGKRMGRYSPAAESKTRTPDEDIRKQAEGYTKEAGISHSPFTGYAPLNEELGKRVADAYEAAPHIPDDPKVQAAYQALATETRAQWDYLTKQGVKFEPWTKEGQPYASSKEMRKDVQDNKHLYFFPTEQGFGEGGKAATNNPMLAPTGIESHGIKLVANDLFRAVHDYFGHAKEGYEFGPRGEYNAYLAHSRMFSDAALPALTAETMGQNSWVNFGKHLRDEAGNVVKKGEKGYIAPQERPFAEQKATALPEDLTKEALGNEGLTFSPGDGKSGMIKTSKDSAGEWEEALKARNEVATPNLKIYNQTVTAAHDEFVKAINLARENYDTAKIEASRKARATPNTTASTTKAYNEAIAPAYKAYTQAVDSARKLHDEITASAWETYRKVRETPSAEDKDKLSYPMEMAPGKAGGKLPGILTAPYAQKEAYQNDMLKAFKPLFDELKVKPGATVQSSYVNSAGETEHNPMTSVELPADKAKLFALMHGYFADQEAVAGGYSEVKPGDWQPTHLSAFSERPETGSSYVDKINAMGPEAQALFKKLDTEISPAISAVNEKWEKKLGLQPGSFSPSANPRAVRSAAVRDEDTGKIYTGMIHAEAVKNYLNEAFPEQNTRMVLGPTEEDYSNLTHGFVTNNGKFLDREQALKRAVELKQYKAPATSTKLEAYSFERQQGKAPRQTFSPRGGEYPAQFRAIDQQRADDNLPPDIIDFLGQEIGGSSIRLSDARKVREGFRPTTQTLKRIFEPAGKLTLDKAAQALEQYGVTGNEDLFDKIERAAAAREKLWEQHVKNKPVAKPYEQQLYEEQQHPFSPSDEDTEARYSSKLKNTVDEKFSGESMPAAQLAAILRNPNNGVKADELKWSGIDEFLKGKQRVTKDEVRDYLHSQDLTPIETTKKAPNDELEWKQFSGDEGDPSLWELSNSNTGIGDIFQIKEEPGRPGETEYSVYIGRGAHAKGTFSTLDEAKQYAEMRFNTRDHDATEYSKYSLPGPKENYREILFQLPKIPTAFESSHWDEKNVVAHARVDDRNNVEGKPGLFVEEVQSDWHQEGRKKGYVEGDPNAWRKPIEDAYAKSIKTAAEINAKAREDAFAKYNAYKGPDIRGNSEEYDRAMAAAGRTYSDAVANAQNVKANAINHNPEKLNPKVPDAPLKNTWQETVFRRLVQLAAQTDKDWIGWTTGSQNADRYGLEKHLRSLTWNPSNGNLTGVRQGGGDYVTLAQDVTEDKLPSYVGKEVASRLASAEVKDPHTGQHILSGLDLKVGGEGMAGFYDKILVDYANKFGKKFGARVSTGKLPGDPKANGWTKEAQPQPVHTLQITPEMKASVKQGIPFYSPAALENAGRRAMKKATSEFISDKGAMIYGGGRPNARKVSDAFDINCGYCEEWAERVRELYLKATGRNDVKVLDPGNLTGDPDDSLAGHVFIRLHGKFYDAQAPKGVSDWKQLPFFEAKKAVSTPPAKQNP